MTSSVQKKFSGRTKIYLKTEEIEKELECKSFV